MPPAGGVLSLAQSLPQSPKLPDSKRCRGAAWGNEDLYHLCYHACLAASFAALFAAFFAAFRSSLASLRLLGLKVRKIV